MFIVLVLDEYDLGIYDLSKSENAVRLGFNARAKLFHGTQAVKIGTNKFEVSRGVDWIQGG